MARGGNMTGFLQTLSGLPLANLRLGGMSVEMTMLALAAVLGFVHLFTAAHFVTQEHGTAWNVGARDNTPPLTGKIAGLRAPPLPQFPRDVSDFRGGGDPDHIPEPPRRAHGVGIATLFLDARRLS